MYKCNTYKLRIIIKKILWVICYICSVMWWALYAQNAVKTNNTSNDYIKVDYGDVSVAVNKDISVWKNVDFPAVFYFPLDKHLLIRDYRNNAFMFDSLDELVRSKQVLDELDTIEIIGACSPVGNEKYNLKLALNRCEALRSYFLQTYPQLTGSFPIQFRIIGIDSLGYNVLKEQKPPLTQKQMWDKLQYAAVCLKMKDGSCIMPAVEEPKIITETVFVRDTVYLKDTTYIVSHPIIPDEQVKTDETDLAKSKKPLFIALKNNLLYDAVLLPNLTAEWYMGKQWSLAVEGNWSWWTFGSPIQNEWKHRIQIAGVELRRWFKSPYPLHGHALGVYGMIGNYDIRLAPEDENSIGELSYTDWSAGLSYAYSFPIARRFNLELGLAVGYVGGRYYKYDYSMNYNHWRQQATYNRSYFGPTRASLSIVWLLGTGNYTNLKNE